MKRTGILTSIVFLLIVTGVQAGINDGLIAHYPMEGDAHDATGNGNGGIEIGEVNYEEGVKGLAASFNGHLDGVWDAIQVQSTDFDQLFDSSNFDWTVSSWFSISGSCVDNAECGIWDKHRGWGDGFGSWVEGGSVYFIWEDYPSSARPYNGNVNYHINNNVWTHATYVKSGMTIKLYINGEFVGSNSITSGTNINNTLDHFYIGARENIRNHQTLEGLVDELRVYNRALSESEINLLYMRVIDEDDDGIVDDEDNCPNASNPDQTDNDSDGIGDTCDPDIDNDNAANEDDNCPMIANVDQADLDNDGLGDMCDSDFDGDTWPNENDNCPAATNIDQIDTDLDGEGDECDINDDNDDYLDADDNCPAVVNNDQVDLDADGIGNVCDLDLDGDGKDNYIDNCPTNVNPSQDDTDSDGEGNACDSDDDADGVVDNLDNCQYAANSEQTDTDGDGIGDACNDANDPDGDEWANTFDNCPHIANSDQYDLDGDGIGDACDPDIDGDGIDNGDDICADTPFNEIVNGDGCSIEQLAPCEGPRGKDEPWRNHGKYVSVVAHAANQFKKTGLLTEEEKNAIMDATANSECGK